MQGHESPAWVGWDVRDLSVLVSASWKGTVERTPVFVAATAKLGGGADASLCYGPREGSQRVQHSLLYRALEHNAQARGRSQHRGVGDRVVEGCGWWWKLDLTMTHGCRAGVPGYTVSENQIGGRRVWFNFASFLLA